MQTIPSFYFFTKGIGKHENETVSFELALRDAGVEGQNFVCCSSILPRGCKRISKEEGIDRLKSGAITHCVMSKNVLSKTDYALANRFPYVFKHRYFASVSSIRYSGDEAEHGYLFEHHGYQKIDEKDQLKSLEELYGDLEKWSSFLLESKFNLNASKDFEAEVQFGFPEEKGFVTLLAMAIFI